MNELAFLQIMLFGLCVLGGISVLIFGLRQCDDDIDYDRIIRELNEREEKDLDIINRGNKQIDELESRILECKKKLGLKLFKRNNIKKIVMLTGDHENISKAVAKELNLDEYHAELLPQDKVYWVEKLMMQKSSGGKLIFIGDGVNDAPVLALSDIGVAMGGVGSDAAMEAADVVIMTDEPSKIASSIQISKKTIRIVRQNIIFSIAVKIIVLILSALGLASMWTAVFADVGVSVLATINAFRILKIKNSADSKTKNLLSSK